MKKINKSKEDFITRFSLAFRLQHISILVSMLILATTGFALVYHNTSFGKMLVALQGGYEMRGWIHRIFAVVLVFSALWHFLQVLFTEKAHREFLKMMPGKKDFFDFLITLKSYLNISSERARFEKFNYIQKFQYWGVFAGIFLMVISGIILWFKEFSMAVFPKWVMDTTLVVHGYEGTIAFVVLFLWHQYNAHLNPDVFPMDKTWIDGKMHLETLKERHPLEYEKIMYERKMMLADKKE